MAGKIQILDCTLRDGGMELQSASKNGYIEHGFNLKTQREIIKHLEKSGVDIIEICSIAEDNEDRTQFGVYGNLNNVSNNLGVNKDKQYAVLYMGPNTDYSTIPYADDVDIKMARMMLRYSELDASLNLCRELASKGYKVFVQPSITMRYSDFQLDKLITLSNEIGAYALYVVDSYGYMSIEDIERIFNLYDSSLDFGIRIGLHAHNNMNLAFSNVQNFIGLSGRRDLIVDSCLCGLGQGAGNLQTELIVYYANLHKHHAFEGRVYDIIPILEACEIIDGFSDVNYSWGYSVPRMISAMCRTSYKYADVLRKKYQFSYPAIYDILYNISDEEIRQRYTDYYVEELAKGYKKGQNYEGY